MNDRNHIADIGIAAKLAELLDRHNPPVPGGVASFGIYSQPEYRERHFHVFRQAQEHGTLPPWDWLGTFLSDNFHHVVVAPDGANGYGSWDAFNKLAADWSAWCFMADHMPGSDRAIAG